MTAGSTTPRFDAFLRQALGVEGVCEDDAQALLGVVTRGPGVEGKLARSLIGAGDRFERLTLDGGAHIGRDRAAAGAPGESAIGARQPGAKQERGHLVAGGRQSHWAHILLQIFAPFAPSCSRGDDESTIGGDR
jgi:hypothetical protein